MFRGLMYDCMLVAQQLQTCYTSPKYRKRTINTVADTVAFALGCLYCVVLIVLCCYLFCCVYVRHERGVGGLPGDAGAHALRPAAPRASSIAYHYNIIV